MTLILFEAYAVRLEVKYVQKKGGVYYFRRRIPHDLRKLYPDKNGQLFFSLKTTDPITAAKKALDEAARQDALWRSSRGGEVDAGPELYAAAEAILAAFGLRPGQHSEYRASGVEPDAFLRELAYRSDTDDGSIDAESLPQKYRLAADLFYGDGKFVPFLSQALDEYQLMAGEAEETKAYWDRRNVVARFMSIAGDRQIDSYRREDARAFVDALRGQGLSERTVKRYVGYVAPVLNQAIVEYDLEDRNIFKALRLRANGEGSSTREPFTAEELRSVQKVCREVDDDLRWLLALVSDTGLRIAEAAGLEMADILLDGETPHLRVTPNSARRLKTRGSTRLVPLVGASLWAAERVVANVRGDYAFPRYVREKRCKATHASNTLNKWLRSQGIDKTLHGLRHSLRDRLREVEAPMEVQDELGGWAKRSVGQGYGQGRSLANLHGWMSKIVIVPEDAMAGAGRVMRPCL